MKTRLDRAKTRLSGQLNRPKSKNRRTRGKKVIDKRVPRDEERIVELQQRISRLKREQHTQ